MHFRFPNENKLAIVRLCECYAVLLDLSLRLRDDFQEAPPNPAKREFDEGKAVFAAPAARRL
jgi:hypothetical protein